MFDSHRILAHWGARVETPRALATRFARMIDALTPIHPVLNDWGWIDGPSVVETEGAAATIPWYAARVDLERRIRRNMGSEDDGVPDEDRRRLYQHARLGRYDMDAVNAFECLGSRVCRVSCDSLLHGRTYDTDIVVHW